MDWDAIKTIGLRRYVKSFVPTARRNPLKLRDLQYHELILEFYSIYTYTFLEDPAEGCMRFRMAGVWFHISLYDFAMALDIHTDEDEIECCWGNRSRFRRQITGQQVYTINSSKVSGITDPRLRLLHRCISVTFFGRLEPSRNVTQPDLNILYSWKKENSYNCPARALAAYFLQFHGQYPAQAITGGHFITVLAHGLGILADDVAATMTIVGRVSSLSVRTFQNIGIVSQQDDTHILLSRTGEPWMPGVVQEESVPLPLPPPPPPSHRPLSFSPEPSFFNFDSFPT